GDDFARHIMTHINGVIEGQPAVLSEETVDFGGRGTPRVYMTSITALHRKAGSLDGLMLQFNDITDIQNARVAAERASTVKSEFLSNMSHEMRTPMNAIIGMTAIGKSAVDIERKDYCFDKLKDASTYLLGVINDILDMAKIEAGKLELSSASFIFEKMLQQVISVINFKMNERKLKFSVYIDSNIPRVLVGDDQRLAQVITNLLSNAVKFTPEGGRVRLEAHLVHDEAGVCTLRLDVTDTGIGISAEQQAKLFTSFQQAESSTSRKFGGTGLGLTISKSIVEMMAGKIWIESELGRGSTFAFTVQMKRGSDERKEVLLPGVNRMSVRLLVVDDDPDVREYFAEIMRAARMACDTAASGEQALAMIAQNGPYDMYFVDWKMPGMDGIEVVRKIKKGGGRHVVIMISSVEWSVIAGDAKSAGVDKFLPKPLLPSSIVDLINECLGAERLTPEVVQAAVVDDDFSGHCILLAEDIEINREIVITLLQPTNLTVDCAQNGLEALRLFEEAPGKYSMIFMDLQMPEMDGFTATRRLRMLECPEAKTIPIIAMTANVFREDIEQCLEAGMNDHIGKPLDFTEVLGKLQRYLAA
ncbi:MAG: response regulator, partial [Deltaproteobacteria bacterium]|nr:response regulator [Deltaproteobacteria bacterium]